MVLDSLRGLQGQSPEEAKVTIAHLRQALRQLINSDHGPHWNVFHALLGSALSECMQEEVVGASQQMAVPALRRMSKECWRSTWSLLCLRDKISVSHVCSLWRSLALDMPSLWATLDFHSSRSSEPSTGTDAVAVHPVPRFLLFSYILERSSPYPLHLSIHLDKTWSDGDCIYNLAACLITHNHRLATVTFHLGFDFEPEWPNAMVVRTFLSQIPSLPALESLIVHHEAKSQFYPGFLPNLINLPALRHLAIPDFSPPKIGHLPSVRRLHCTYSSTPQLVAFMKLCPNLCDLDVTMDNTFTTRNGTGDGSDVLRRLLSPIERLHVHNICAASEEKASALLRHLFLPEVMLHYGPQTFSFDGFRIFEDIEHPTEVECRIERGRTILKTCDASQPQRLRGISFRIGGDELHSEPALQMWSKLCPKLLTTVTIDMRMLPTLFMGLPEASTLRHLTIILPRYYHFETVIPDFINPKMRPTVPQLQVVRLQGDREFGPRPVSAATVTTLLRYLGIAQNYHHLQVHVEHLDLRGNVDSDICAGGFTVVYHKPRDYTAAARRDLRNGQVDNVYDLVH